MPAQHILTTTIDTVAGLHKALQKIDAQTDADTGLERVIEFAPGEYKGMLVIDKPVTLRGLGRRTVLWRRAGPVVRVRAPNVRLEKLLIERTVSADGPLVVHDPGCAPVLKGFKGADFMAESVQINAETLIDLGELTPGSPITLPIRVETTGRAQIAVTGLYGAQVMPAVLPGPGAHTVMLSLDAGAVVRGEVLLGEITLREGGAAVRYLWVSGTVLDGPPPARNLCLVARKNVFHPSVGGLLLDGVGINPLLNALGIGEMPNGLHAVVQRDLSGGLALYLPGEPPTPVTINGRAAARQSRKLLHEGDTIHIGPATFGVAAAEPPPVELGSTVLAFDDFDAHFPEPVKFGLRTLGKGWRGQILSTLPWLSILPEGYYRLPPNRANDWTAALNEHALTLDDGLYDVPGGLMVMGEGHVIAVDVRLRVARPPVALQVAPLDIGQAEVGWADGQVFNVAVANLGRGAWAGELRANVPWLSVLTPMPFGGGPWSEAMAQVALLPVPSGFAPGPHEVADALVVVADVADNLPPVRQSVAVTLTVRPAMGHLVAEVEKVEFPDVERGTTLPAMALRLDNEGGAPWRGVVAPTHGWVGLRVGDMAGADDAAPALSQVEIDVPAGGSQRVVLVLLDIPADQPLDQAFTIDELRFTPGPSAAPCPPVPISLTLVERPPRLTARPVEFPPFVRGDNPPEAILTVQNNGPTAWQGQVAPNVAWVSAPSRTFGCAPGESVEIHITLSPKTVESLAQGISRWENALTVSGGRDPLAVGVRVDVRDVPADLILETPTMNFGLVGAFAGGMSGRIEGYAETVRILNAGGSAWRATAKLNVPWLSFEGGERVLTFELPKANSAEFKVVLNDLILNVPPGLVLDDHALSLDCTELVAPSSNTPATPASGALAARAKTATLAPRTQSLHTRALMIVQEAAPWLVASPEKITLRGLDPAKLTINNEGGKRWALQVYAAPYLEVTPGELALNAGQAGLLSVRVNEQAETPSVEARAIVIVGPGREVEIPVEITTTAARRVREQNGKVTGALAASPKPIDEGALKPSVASGGEQPVEPSPPPAPPIVPVARPSQTGRLPTPDASPNSAERTNPPAPDKREPN